MKINKEGYLLKIYQEKCGTLPLIDWLNSIKDITLRARINNRLRRIEIGNLGDYKFLSSGIYELKLCFGSGYRIYFGIKEKIVILLLCGGDKSSQKKDIKKAIEYWKDYNNK